MSETFILRGLVSRAGLSNWVFIFTPASLLMIDLGAWASVKAGLSAGAGSQLPLDLVAEVRDGLKPEAPQIEGAYADLARKWKRVVQLEDSQIRSVTLHLTLWKHRLFVVGADGLVRKFALERRPEAQAARNALPEILGSRFRVTTTPLYALLSRHAPLLTQ